MQAHLCFMRKIFAIPPGPSVISGLQIFAATAFLLASPRLSAQNLISNPGFEDVLTPEAYNWVQPQGDFYHYEQKKLTGNEGARTGAHINGICMYSHEPNEYLHIKLKDTLRAGERYAFSVFARLMPAKSQNAHAQKYIGVFFGRERLNTHIPGDFYLEPQLRLKLPRSDRFAWFPLADTLTAKGGEQFMTVGYFPEIARAEARENASDAFMAEIEREYAALTNAQNTDDDKRWLYLPREEQEAYLKEKKKRDRKLRKKRKKLAKKMRGNCPNPARPQTAKASGKQVPIPGEAQSGPFRVRYYFDDFCLAPLIEGRARCDAEGERVDVQSLKAGDTFSLRNVFFDTDEDVLLKESEVQLEALRVLLESRPRLVIEIRGHTDNRGSADYNLDLSRRRSAAVVDWLIGAGIASDRLSSRGFGETAPVASNEDEAGRALNRRVEFFVVKSD